MRQKKRRQNGVGEQKWKNDRSLYIAQRQKYLMKDPVLTRSKKKNTNSDLVSSEFVKLWESLDIVKSISLNLRKHFKIFTENTAMIHTIKLKGRRNFKRARERNLSWPMDSRRPNLKIIYGLQNATDNTRDFLGSGEAVRLNQIYRLTSEDSIIPTKGNQNSLTSRFS